MREPILKEPDEKHINYCFAAWQEFTTLTHQEEASIKDTLEVYIESLQELEAQQKLNDFHRGSLFAYERALRLMEFEEDDTQV